MAGRRRGRVPLRDDRDDRRAWLREAELEYDEPAPLLPPIGECFMHLGRPAYALVETRRGERLMCEVCLGAAGLYDEVFGSSS